MNVVKDVAIQRSHYPLGFGYLVAFCRERGLDFDVSYSEFVSDGLLRAVKPDVVCFTCTTENFNLCRFYADKVKIFDDGIVTVVGGVHVSAVPKVCDGNFDVVVVGEGEQTFYELAKNGFEPNSMIKGLWYGEGFTGKRELIEPLDMLPFPDVSMFNLGYRVPYILTSRGCSYDCKFCSSRRFWERVRLHSAERVAGEILWYKKCGVKELVIFDDNFALSRQRVFDVANLVGGYGMRFAVNCRANQVTDSLCRDFKRMGVVKVGMGLESNSLRVLDWLGKGNTPLDNQRAVDYLRSYGIDVVCSFICGTPVEDESDLRETYGFIKRNKLKFDMYELMRFPNTELYDGSVDWDGCVVRCRHKV